MRGTGADPVALWQSLPLETQHRIAEGIAERRAAEFKRAYTNVVGVGAGYKLRGRRFKKAGDGKVVCLIFTVAGGTKGSFSKREDHPQRIPEHVSAYATIGRRRRRVAIPTDVIELAPAQEAAGVASPAIGSYVRAVGRTRPGVKSARGSNCCVVRSPDFPGDRYLLGCHHVFTRSAANCCDPLEDSDLVWDASTDRIGSLAYWANLTPAPPRYGMDAALVQIDDGVSLANEHAGHRLRRWWNGDTRPPDRFTLCTPRGELPADYVGAQHKLVFVYTCDTQVSIRVALMYRAKTRRGDSGSPLYTDDGTLLGMHFYGTDDGLAYAIPAYQLFDAPIFAIRIDLA